jgi:exopolysaccharide biosynthesis protein
MKNISKILLLLSCFLSIKSSEIESGVIYNKVNNNEALIHELIVDPKKVKIIIAAANNKCASAQKPSDMSMQSGAIAGINGGFFDFGVSNKFKDNAIKLLDFFGFANYNAFPMYALKIKNHWFSLANKVSGILAWKNDGQYAIVDAVENSWALHVDDKIYPIADLNKPYANGSILYTSAYCSNTPLRKNKIDIIIENNKVIKIKKGGYSNIPENGFVYSIDKYEKYLNLLDFNEFSNVTIDKRIVSKYYDQEVINGMDYVLGSTPILIKNGEIIEVLYEYKNPFYTDRHPRTAIGILPDGKWLLLVVDGRNQFSKGFTMLQLAEYMKSFGCIDALNLDGGGSSTMIVNNKIVNSPSGRDLYGFTGKRGERPIADSILILSK